MNVRELFIGALTLRTATYAQLRERADAFLYGFVVLAIAVLISGAVTLLADAVRASQSVSREQVLAQANAIFEQNYNGPPAMRAQIQPYVTESASMIYELEQLEPQAGAIARPVGNVLRYIGNVFALPFQWAYVGWTLFAALLFGTVAWWLGGRGSLNQMLGLTALAAAPQIFLVIPALLTLFAALTNLSALTCVNGLIGFAIALWSAVIYVKATSVAQQISIARALGAIVLGYVLVIGIVIAMAILLGIVVSIVV